MNLTIIINSPVKQLSLFAITKYGENVKITNSNITFILNANVEQFAGLSSTIMNTTIVNTNLILTSDSAQTHGSISLLADRIGNVIVNQSTFMVTAKAERYYGLSMLVQGDSKIDNVTFQGKITSTSASGLAEKLYGSLTLTNFISKQHILAYEKDSTFGVKQITQFGFLTINGAEFNAILESGKEVAGNVFFTESAGTFTATNLRGNITGNWENWCGAQCDISTDNLNNIIITRSQMALLTSTTGFYTVFTNENDVNLNNTRISFEDIQYNLGMSGKFSLFSGFKYFYNITIKAQELKFNSDCDVGFLYAYDGFEAVKLHSVTLKVRIFTHNGTVALLSLRAAGSTEIQSLRVEDTTLAAHNKAALLFNQSLSQSSIHINNLTVKNTTQVRGKEGIGGLITEVSGFFSITNSDLRFAVVAEDLKTSSAFIYKSQGIIFNLSNKNNHYEIRGIYMTTDCVIGGPCNAPSMAAVLPPKITVSTDIFTQRVNSQIVSCSLDPEQNYNSTVIQISKTYNANGQHYSLFCNLQLFYNVTIENSEITVTNAFSTGILTTVMSTGAAIYNTQLNNVRLNTDSQGGLIAGQALADVKMTNVKINGSIICGSKTCGGILGVTNYQINGDNVAFWGTVSGSGAVAVIVGNMGTQKVNISNANIYASVTSLGSTDQGRALCQSNVVFDNFYCNVRGNVQVSGTYNGCPGPSQDEDTTICQRLTVHVNSDNFNPVLITTKDPFDNQISFSKSGILPAIWDLNRSTVNYANQGYSQLGNFSFFGNDKLSFNDVIITGSIVLDIAQSFAGFIFATNNHSDRLMFTNCDVQVKVQGKSVNIAGYIFSNVQTTEIQQSNFSGHFKNGCHVAGFIYMHGGGELVMNKIMGQKFGINESASECQSWNQIQIGSAILIGHIKNVQNLGYQRVNLENIEFNDSWLQGNGYVGGVTASIDGSYEIFVKNVQLNSINVVGVISSPFGTFAGKVSGSGNYTIDSFMFIDGSTNLSGTTGNFTFAGLFIGQLNSNLKRGTITLRPTKTSVFGTCPYGYASLNYVQDTISCLFDNKRVQIDDNSKLQCDYINIDVNKYQDLAMYKQICYFKELANGAWNNSIINVKLNEIGNKQGVKSPFILTLFPPSVKYFTNIQVSGDIIENNYYQQVAVAFFIPYIIDAPAIFINCSINGGLKFSNHGQSRLCILSKFAVAAFNHTYFYDAQTKVNFLNTQIQDLNVLYGGYLTYVEAGVNVHFSEILVGDTPASYIQGWSSYDVSNNQSQLILQNKGKCTILQGKYTFNPVTTNINSKYSAIYVTAKPVCRYISSEQLKCDYPSDYNPCEYVR